MPADRPTELTSTPDSAPFIERLRSRLGAGPFAVLTGAGLSTASGIPAYRDRDGRWQHPRPVQHQEFIASESVRRRYWARSFVGWARMSRALPNAGHRAIAALQATGHLGTVITQNVDGLHTVAGSADTIELHGGIARIRCLACHRLEARAHLQSAMHILNPGFQEQVNDAARTAPDGDAHLADEAHAGFQVPACPDCHGMLKPDVVFFGDNVPRERVEAARRAVERSHGLLVVGSSLMVYSGYRFAEQAHRLGKPVVAINQGVTRADALLSDKWEGDCGTVLERVQQLLAPRQESPSTWSDGHRKA